jgi:hypothetical protein
LRINFNYFSIVPDVAPAILSPVFFSVQATSPAAETRIGRDAAGATGAIAPPAPLVERRLQQPVLDFLLDA